MPEPAPKPDSDHGPDGRFVKDNKGGPGNPSVRRMAEYQQAVRDAVKPEHLKLVMQRLLQSAVKEGDVHAARVLLDRCLGKAGKQAGEKVEVDLGQLRSIVDLVRAQEQLVTGVLSGEVPADMAAKLSGMIEATRRAYETEHLSARIDALERNIDGPASRGPVAPVPEPEKPT